LHFKTIIFNTLVTLKTDVMKKITYLALLISVLSNAQVLLIDPAAEGGFEEGTTWEANGWTVVNPTGTNMNRRWYLGTGQEGYTGQRAAFIGNNETTVGNANITRKIHFYRAVTFPEGATNIVLTFKYKQETADFSGGTYYDYIQVNTANNAPVNNAEPPGTVRFGPFPDVSVPLFTTQTVTLPDNLAGTTKNLIFSYISDNADPRGFGAIDDISLTYTATASATDFEQKKLTYYPNPVKDVLHLKYDSDITSIEVYNLLGQQVLYRTLNTPEPSIDLSVLPAGNYVAKILAADKVSTAKFSKL
jgi:hypothetical protein